MALIKQVENNTFTLRLNGGTSATGAIETISLNFSGIKKATLSDADKEKLIAIADAMRPLLRYAVYKTAITTREVIETDE